MIGKTFEEVCRKRWRQASRQLTYDKNYVTAMFNIQKKKKENVISILTEIQFPATNAEYYGDKRIKGNLRQQFELLFTKKQLIKLRNGIDKVLKRPAIKRMD